MILAQIHAQLARLDNNLVWLNAHASKAYSHRGKVICVAGQDLFVGDMVTEVLAKAWPNRRSKFHYQKRFDADLADSCNLADYIISTKTARDSVRTADQPRTKSAFDC